MELAASEEHVIFETVAALSMADDVVGKFACVQSGPDTRAFFDNDSNLGEHIFIIYWVSQSTAMPETFFLHSSSFLGGNFLKSPDS